MKRLFLILFLLFAIGFAYQAKAAVPCSEESFYDGYAGSFYGTSVVKGYQYGLDETYMYVQLTSGTITGFIHVPQGTAQAMNYTKTPDTFYATQIQKSYPRPLMTEKCHNILTEAINYLLESGAGTVSTANSRSGGPIFNGVINGLPISALPPARDLTGTELMPVYQNGVAKQATIAAAFP